MTTQVLAKNVSEKLDFINLPKINLSKIWIFGFILITSLLIFYIFQISEITKASFSASGYEQEIIKISQQNKNLEISLSQENSLVNLEALLEKLNYEKVNKINYIRFIDNQVAAKP